MADVFLSYASEDRAAASKIAAALIAEGFSVWWDRDLLGGADFAAAIGKELDAAKVVVVLWSPHARLSKWVRDEAAHGRDANRLIPLSLDAEKPPLGFRQVHTTDFASWKGDASEQPFVSLAGSLRSLAGAGGIAAAGPAPSAAPQPKPGSRRGLIFIAATGLLLATSVAAFLVISPYTVRTSAVALGKVAIKPFEASPPDPARAARASSYAAAFRQRLTELGVANESAKERRAGQAPEIILAGELVSAGDGEVLADRFEDSRTGETLWSGRGEPSEGAVAEANLAGYALKCALKRRDPKRGAAYLSRFISACALALEGDWRAEHSAARALVEAAPGDPGAAGYFARATMSLAWVGSNSKAEHARHAAEGKRLIEAALKLDPKNADALFARVFGYDDSKFADQERVLLEAIDADPELGFALGRYANLLMSVGRQKEALDYYARAQLHRRNSSGTLSRLLASSGDPRLAREEYDRVRPLGPAFIDRHEMMTDVLYGDIDETQRRLAGRPELAGKSLACWTEILRARRKERVDLAHYRQACGGGGGESAQFLTVAGDLDGAYLELELEMNASDGRFAPHLFWPDMRAFWLDERFFPLAARLGLVGYWLDTDQWPDFCAEPDFPIDCRERAAAAGRATDKADPR
ncbi:MAG: toll/interleukin-1 receptor domain-containing protein [Parvularculaceae bacterium]